MKIRTATMADLAAVAAVEKACFPPAEAATADEFRDRLAHYAAHFWLLFDDKGDLVSFVDGMVTDERDLTDAMYAQAAMHDEKGAWQMIFGVNTPPPWLCREAPGSGHCRRQAAGTTGPGPDLQRQAPPVLCEIRLPERRHQRLRPRRRHLVPDAPDF